MRKVASILIVYCVIGPVTFAAAQSAWSPPATAALVKYLRSHAVTPEDYVISKFQDHDIVFIGEYHRIKHDVELIHRLVPRLYKAHIYNLGIEFGPYEEQDKVDKLITADSYDESLARWLIFHGPTDDWGFKEYEDIYRAAWDLNRSLPKNARKFRVVNLTYRPNWTARKEEMTSADWDKVWWQGDYDAHMADVIIKEFVNKHEKALIYSGQHHAFTRYHQPIYDYQTKKVSRLNSTRMGNLIYDKIGDRAFNIYLHAPWASKTSATDTTRPVHGVIDAVMESFGDKPVGFDVRGTPFGAISDDSSYYAVGYANFTLGSYCDGYIFQRRLEDYEGVTIDRLFITDANLQEAIAYFANPTYRLSLKTPEDFFVGMRQDTNFKWRFRNLK